MLRASAFIINDDIDILVVALADRFVNLGTNPPKAVDTKRSNSEILCFGFMAISFLHANETSSSSPRQRRFEFSRGLMVFENYWC
jgi:hypothetical protein